MPAVAARVKSAKIDRDAQDEILRQLLTRVGGLAEVVWQDLAASGATDPAITRAIETAYGQDSSFTDDQGRSAYFQKTFGVPIWFGTSKAVKRAGDLSAGTLIMAVRRIFSIELPSTNGRHPANGIHHVAGDIPPSQTSTTLPDGIARQNGVTKQVNDSAESSGETVTKSVKEKRGRRGNGQLPLQAAPSDAVSPAAPSRIVVIQEIEIPLDKIKPSPENPREDFDEKFLDQLGASLRDHGQLSPLSVRTPDLAGMHEIIDGETRYRAAQKAGLASLRCQVTECTDAEAALARVLSYRQRRDLNPLEEARGLQLLLQKYGCSQRELEAKIGLSQGQISNRIRLLKLPKAWQQRVISHEITASQARDLAVWHDVPEAFKELEKLWQHDLNLDDGLIRALRFASRELLGFDYQAGGNWKLDVGDPQVREALRIRPVPTWEKETEDRAFNTKLADELKAEAFAKLKVKASKKSERAEAAAKSKDLSPAERQAKARQQAEQLNRKIYRYKVAWLQRAILSRFTDGGAKPHYDQCVLWLIWFAGQEQYHRRCGEVIQACGDKDDRASLAKLQQLCGTAVPIMVYRMLTKWLGHSFEGYHTDLRPWMIESFAEQIGISLADGWKLDEAFLELFTTAGLIDLVGEWKLGMYFSERKKGAIVGSSTLESLKRVDLIKKILDLNRGGLKPPKCLLKVKEVSLT